MDSVSPLLSLCEENPPVSYGSSSQKASDRELWSLCSSPEQAAEQRVELLVNYGAMTNATSLLLSGVPDYFGRNKISSGGDLSHYSSASLY